MRVQLADGAKRDFADGLRWYRKRSVRPAEGFVEEINYAEPIAKPHTFDVTNAVCCDQLWQITHLA